MNDLCEDIQRHIVRHCNRADALALRSTSAIWPNIIDTSILSIAGPVNGTTFSSATLEVNGPIFMPHVNTVIIDADGLLDGLEALKLRTLKRDVDLIVASSRFLFECSLFVSTHSWRSVTINSSLMNMWAIHSVSTLDGLNGLAIDTHELKVYAEEFLNVRPSQRLRRLTLHGFSHSDYANVFEHIFNFKLDFLELFGVLTDTAVRLCAAQPLESLTELRLHNEGICEWTYAAKLQTLFPNVAAFALRSSNLIRSDFYGKFDLLKWPLRHLDLENNMTLDYDSKTHDSKSRWDFLEGLQLESLRIMKCSRYKMPLVAVIGLKTLSISCHAANLRSLVFAHPALKCLHIQLISFLQREHLQEFEALRHLDYLEITFNERFEVPRHLAAIRAICTCTLVVQA